MKKTFSLILFCFLLSPLLVKAFDPTHVPTNDPPGTVYSSTNNGTNYVVVPQNFSPKVGGDNYYVITQPPRELRNVNDVLRLAAQFGNVIIYVLVAFAVVYIVYYVVWYIIKGNNSEEKLTASKNIMWAILGLFIIVSLWGLVNILVNTFSTSNEMPNRIPNANFIDIPE